MIDIEGVLDPLTVGDGKARFPTLWHLCWFLQSNFPDLDNDDILELAQVILRACSMVANPYIGEVKCGRIPSPFSLDESWILLQWRSKDGQNLPPNSIIFSGSNRILLPWIADAWIPSPNGDSPSAFAQDFSRSEGPVFNTHVRQLACYLAFTPLVPNMFPKELVMPLHEKEWWKAYRANSAVHSYKPPEPPLGERERYLT